MVKIRPRSLLVLHGDPAFRESLRRATAPDHRLVPASGWDDLLVRVAAASASALVVVDPRANARPRAGVAPGLDALLHRFPSVPVVAAMRLDAGSFELARGLGLRGVAQILCLDEDRSEAAIRRRLDAARGRTLWARIERALPPTTGGPARSILQSAAAVATDGGSGRQLARALCVTPRTLLRWCRRAGLPPPKHLLPWMRILLAAGLLDDPGRNVADAARAVGYASDSSLRHATGTLLGMPPGALRRRGATHVATRAFVEALAAARRPNRRYRRVRSSRAA